MNLNQPSLMPISDSGEARYELERDYVYVWYAEGQTWRIMVRKGFQTDGASVPSLGTLLTGIGRDGLHRAAALIHDFIYRHGGGLPHGSFRRWSVTAGAWLVVSAPWDRKQTDKLFANMLTRSGVSKFRRRTMYLAVRAFGWRWWRGGQD